jgi:hypothetical protein
MYKPKGIYVGRPLKKWKDSVLVQALLNMIMNIQVPQKWGIS